MKRHSSYTNDVHISSVLV